MREEIEKIDVYKCTETSSRISHDRVTGRAKHYGMLISLINRKTFVTLYTHHASLASLMRPEIEFHSGFIIRN